MIFFFKMKVEKQNYGECDRGRTCNSGIFCYVIYMLRITDLFEALYV